MPEPQKQLQLRSDQIIKLLLALAMLSTFACTTRKDGFVYRVFHNTTARYNGYFYAKEAMRESQMTLNEKQEDDYDEILSVFIYGSEENAQEIFPLMERVVEKSSRVIERHNMDPPRRQLKKKRDRPEMNKWIDDNYLLIGKAYFFKQNYYKAEEMFLFVSRKYKEKEMQALSNAWLTRCYLEVGDFVRAKNAVRKAVQVNNLEEEAEAEVLMVYADYFIRIGEYKDAADQLEKAIRLIKKKKDKARPTFILAQLMQAQGKAQDAIAYFNGVLKLRPEYEMEFYAKIMQAMAFDRRGGNSAVIKETLFDMLKDDKNEEYQDQIYYALAQLELEEQNRAQGIDYLETSLLVNEGNQKQKMKSFLSLADLYLEDKAYQLAQAYYDSTFRNIEEDHDRYEDVRNKAESLTELVTYLNVIDEKDSLAMLCELGDEELVAKLEGIRQQQIDELEAAMLAAQQAAAAGESSDVVGGAGTFWPYNPALRQTGKSNFTAYWGMRELADDWRRSNKISATFSDGEEEPTQEEAEAQVTEEVSIEDQVPSVDEMLAQLPCSDQAQGESQIAIADAYYNSGVIYREKLEDLDNAIEQWEVLVTRYDESEYHPTAFYLLYRTYLFKESQGYQNPFCGTCNSRHWGDMILERYPGSEWAMLVENPEYQDYAELKKAEERRAYEQVLDKYYKRQYQNVILETTEVIANEPENHMLCKYKLLKAQGIGGMDGRVGMRDNYIKELEKIVAECPDTEEAAFAADKLKKLREEIKEEQKGEPEEEVVEEYPFDFNEGSRHYFMLVLPMGEGNVNEIKAQLSDFSSKYFKSGGLKVSSNLIDRDHQVVLVKTFNRIAESTAFYNTFQSSEDTKSLRDAGYVVSLISKENYVTLFKNKDLEAYQGFFLQNYEL